MSFSEKIKQFFGFSPPEQKITAHDFLLNGDDLTCEMLGYWQEYQLRDLAFNCCVNLIANAIAKTVPSTRFRMLMARVFRTVSQKAES